MVQDTRSDSSSDTPVQHDMSLESDQENDITSEKLEQNIKQLQLKVKKFKQKSDTNGDLAIDIQNCSDSIRNIKYTVERKPVDKKYKKKCIEECEAILSEIFNRRPSNDKTKDLFIFLRPTGDLFKEALRYTPFFLHGDDLDDLEAGVDMALTYWNVAFNNQSEISRFYSEVNAERFTLEGDLRDLGNKLCAQKSKSDAISTEELTEMIQEFEVITKQYEHFRKTFKARKVDEKISEKESEVRTQLAELMHWGRFLEGEAKKNLSTDNTLTVCDDM